MSWISTFARASTHRALMVVVLAAASACVSTAPTVDPHPGLDNVVALELEGAIKTRETRGLRSDRQWVLDVLSDPTSVTVDGLRVSPREAADLEQRDLARTVRLRRDLGLRADQAWVLAVRNDPESVVRQGLRMSADEAANWDIKVRNQLDIAAALNEYGRLHVDEWAGTYLNERGNYVVLVSKHDREHAVAIAELFPATVAIEVVRVRWTLSDLTTFRRLLEDPATDAWLRGHDMMMVRYGIDIRANRVSLEVVVEKPTVNPGQLISRHLDGKEWLLVAAQEPRETVVGTGALSVALSDRAGKPINEAICWLKPDREHAAGDNALQVTDETGACRWPMERPIGVGNYTLEIWTIGLARLLGEMRVTIKDNEETVAVIEVSP